MLRRLLFGVIGVAAVCGAVTAGPPGLQPRPLAEGRELDPVTRDGYLAEPAAPVSPYVAPAADPGADDGRSALWSLLLGAHEAVTGEFTMPLGTVAPPDLGV